jgi:hypothetical protein
LNSGLVPKLNGEHRHIMKMDSRKEDIEKRSYESSSGNMPAKEEAPRGGLLMMSADQKKAYWQYLASTRQQLRMHFWNEEGELMMMLVMAMGFITASHGQNLVCTGLRDIVMAKFGIRVSTYADEYRIAEPSPVLAVVSQLALVLTGTFLGLRFGLGVSKTMLDGPTTRLDWTGYTFDSTRNTIGPMQGRWETIAVIASAFVDYVTEVCPTVPMPADLRKEIPAYSSTTITGAMWGRLNGILSSCVGISIHAGFWSVRIQNVNADHAREHQSGYPESAIISRAAVLTALGELQFWSSRHRKLETVQLPMPGPNRAFATMDASCYGYSGESSTDPGFRAEDFFTPAEVRLNDHNALEAIGTARTVSALVRHWDRPAEQQFADRHWPTKFTVLSDNSTVVAAINKMRSRCIEVAELAGQMVMELADQGLLVSATHLEKAKMDATDCDDRSRRTSSIWEWALHRDIFVAIVEGLAGPDRLTLRRTVDLFAACSSAQSSSFVSWRHDSDNLWTDAFAASWDPAVNPLLHPDDLLYVFPPETLATRAMLKIEQECSSVSTLVVLPLFHKTRLDIFERLLIGQPMVWGGGSRSLIPPESREVNPLNERPDFSFIAGILSAPPGLRAVIPLKQQTRRWAPGGPTAAGAWIATGAAGAPSSKATATARRISTGVH